MSNWGVETGSARLRRPTKRVCRKATRVDVQQSSVSSSLIGRPQAEFVI